MKSRLLLLLLAIFSTSLTPKASLRTGLFATGALAGAAGFGVLKALQKQAEKRALLDAHRHVMNKSDSFWSKVNYRIMALRDGGNALGVGGAVLALAALASLFADQRFVEREQVPQEPEKKTPNNADNSTVLSVSSHSSKAPPADSIDLFHIDDTGMSGEQLAVAQKVNAIAEKVKKIVELEKQVSDATSDSLDEAQNKLAALHKEIRQDQDEAYRAALDLPEDQQHAAITALNGDGRIGGVFETKAPPKPGWQNEPSYYSRVIKPHGYHNKDKGSGSLSAGGADVRQRFNQIQSLDVFNDDLTAVEFFSLEQMQEFSPYMQQQAQRANFRLARKHVDQALVKAENAKAAGRDNYQDFVPQALQAYHQYLHPTDPASPLVEEMKTFDVILADKRLRLAHTEDEYVALMTERKEQERKRLAEQQRAREAERLARLAERIEPETPEQAQQRREAERKSYEESLKEKPKDLGDRVGEFADMPVFIGAGAMSGNS